MSETRQQVKWELKIPGFAKNLTGRCYLFGSSEEDFEDRVRRLGLEDHFARAFPQTKPIYFGWFIESPLNSEQTELLISVIADLAEAPSEHDYGVREFLSALRLSFKADLDLSVEYTPPGHADFGVHTIHCHCPRCKARTPINPWKPPFPVAVMDCGACGYAYSPAATSSRTIMPSFSTVTCVMCHQSIPGDLFAEDDRALIERYLYLRQFEAELKMVNLVGDFAARHTLPDLPLKWSVRGELVDQYIASCAPDSLTERDFAALAYWKKSSFDPAARAGFLTQGIQERLSKLDGQIVSCPKCHGALF